MTPSQLKRREVLLARNDAALERCPDRSGEEFTHTIEEVARGLEALACEVDATGGDQLERSRNWRYVGNAYFDLAQGKEVNKLKLASDAYQKAETLLESIRNTIETMKLNYSYGQALLGLSGGTHLAPAREAKRRFSLALTIARANCLQPSH